MTRSIRFTFRAICLFPLMAATLSCSRHTSPAGLVVLYTSVDEPYVRPLVEQFQKETGIAVRLVTDAEASKSVGLAGKLEAERNHPQADVWWDNEVFLSVRLADEGVLAPYDSPAAADVPAQFKDPHHLWAGSVLRVRTLVSSPKADQKATKLNDLLRPEWKGRVALARPTAGTTGGHVAALYAAWGEAKASDFFHKLHDNGVQLLGGNAQVAEAVARGDAMAGLCDNDDAAAVQNEVGKVDTALPDQGADEQGTLAMPCSVSLVAGAPHADAAKKLIDFILSERTTQSLVQAHFGWCSVRDTAHAGKWMTGDYQATAKTMPAAIRTATAILEGR